MERAAKRELLESQEDYMLLKQERDQLRAEVESLRQDAERDHWLINYMASSLTDLDDYIVGAFSTDNPEHLDAFIKKP